MQPVVGDSEHPLLGPRVGTEVRDIPRTLLLHLPGAKGHLLPRQGPLGHEAAAGGAGGVGGWGG